MTVKKALGCAVDPELIRLVLEAVAEIPADDREADDYLFASVKLLKDRGFADGERPIIATAIGFRLEALARLTRDGGGKGWVLPGEAGSDFIHDELVRCAAEEPLIEDGGQVAFDSESFHRRLLSLAAMHGEA